MKVFFSNAKNTLKIAENDKNRGKNKNICIMHRDLNFPVVEVNPLGFRYKVLFILKWSA